MESGLPDTSSGKGLFTALIFEFFGTAFMICAYNYSDGSDYARSFIYFVLWIIAVSITGAHFNPATTLAVFIHEQKYSYQKKLLLTYLVAQFLGAFLGILISFCVLKEGTIPPLLYPSTHYVNKNGNHEYLNVIWMEFFLTFTFTTIFLLLKNKFSTKNSDEIVKGLAIAFAFNAILSIQYGSGGCLNPALGVA